MFSFGCCSQCCGYEKFGVPVNQPPDATEMVEPDRVAALEEKFQVLQAGLNELLNIHRDQGEGGYASLPDVPSTPPPVMTATPNVGAPPGLGELRNYPGLDPGQWLPLCKLGSQRNIWMP